MRWWAHEIGSYHLRLILLQLKNRYSFISVNKDVLYLNTIERKNIRRGPRYFPRVEILQPSDHKSWGKSWGQSGCKTQWIPTWGSVWPFSHHQSILRDVSGKNFHRTITIGGVKINTSLVMKRVLDDSVPLLLVSDILSSLTGRHWFYHYQYSSLFQEVFLNIPIGVLCAMCNHMCYC